MSDRHDDIRAMVREQLQRRNPPGTEAMYGRAVRINPKIRRLDLRQFNARYVLPERRALKRSNGLNPRDEERVETLVKRRLVDEPEVSVERLYRELPKLAPSVEELDLNQFEARYVLHIRSELAKLVGSVTLEEGVAPTTGGPSIPADGRHEAVRQVLLEFAVELAGAEGRSAVVRVMTRIDEYVDRVLEG